MISTAKARMARAIVLANKGIAAVNATDHSAYVLVDGIAKGDCSADAPGPLPPPYAAMHA